MKILVTGGCGLIGSHLVERLVKGGNEVIVIDNLSTGVEKNIEGLDVRLITWDCSFAFNAILRDHPIIGAVDTIFHLGMPSSSPMYKADLSLVGKTIGEAVQLFEYAKKCKSKVIIASTSSLYNGYETPFSEHNNLPFPLDFYTETRYAIERLANLYNYLYGMKCVILRLFSVYGPREEHKGKYANIISQFLWDMKKDKAPVIYGDGTQTRDFIYVDNVVDAFILALKYESDSVEIFNIGTGKSASFNEVVQLLNEEMRPIYAQLQPLYEENKIKNYIQHTLADTSKSERLLDFKAKVSLEEGVKKLVRVEE